MGLKAEPDSQRGWSSPVSPTFSSSTRISCARPNARSIQGSSGNPAVMGLRPQGRAVNRSKRQKQTVAVCHEDGVLGWELSGRLHLGLLCVWSRTVAEGVCVWVLGWVSCIECVCVCVCVCVYTCLRLCVCASECETLCVFLCLALLCV